MQMQRRQGDERLYVQFFLDAVEDQEATEREGRPIFKNVEFIRIIPPANEMSSGEERITIAGEQYKKRFAHDYKLFKATQAEVVDGTPIKTWPAVSIAQVKELQAHGIQTIEQLTELEGKELRLNPWLQPFKEKADAWINSINSQGEVLRLTAEVQELRKTIDFMKEEKEELIASLKAANAINTASKKVNSKTEA
jgi:hypothetical protein